MQVIPVAGRDSMLLNLSGAHGPFFTRNIVILTDNAGHTGVGEVPGGEKIRQTLEDARALVDRPDHRRAAQHPRESMRTTLRRPRRRRPRQADLRPARRRSTPSPRSKRRCSICSASTRRARRRAARRRPAAQRVETLGYLFYVGDRTQDRSALPQRARSARTTGSPAPSGGADAGGRRAARRSGAGPLRLRRFQAEGRRAARRAGDRGRHGARRALSRGARDARSQRRMVARRGDPPLQGHARRPRLCRGPLRRRRRLLRPRDHGGVPPRHGPADRDQHDRDRLAATGARAARSARSTFRWPIRISGPCRARCAWRRPAATAA